MTARSVHSLPRFPAPKFPYKLILNGFMNRRGRSTPDAFIALERFRIEDAPSVDDERAAAY